MVGHDIRHPGRKLRAGECGGDTDNDGVGGSQAGNERAGAGSDWKSGLAGPQRWTTQGALRYRPEAFYELDYSAAHSDAHPR